MNWLTFWLVLVHGPLLVWHETVQNCRCYPDSQHICITRISQMNEWASYWRVDLSSSMMNAAKRSSATERIQLNQSSLCQHIRPL